MAVLLCLLVLLCSNLTVAMVILAVSMEFVAVEAVIMAICPVGDIGCWHLMLLLFKLLEK